jgi:predicted nucleic acid-binding protein
VLDTSVAVKWYLPEELHDQAIGLLRRAEAGGIELFAPGTIQPEFFNALWWHHRREGLPLDRVRASWEGFAWTRSCDLGGTRHQVLGRVQG